MAATVLLEVPRGDLQYFEDLKAQGHHIEIVETDRQQGFVEYVDVLVTLTVALTPIIVAYIRRPVKSPVKTKVVIDGQRRSFENYNAEDIIKMLEQLDP
jgi:hypothetical protein